MDVGYLCTILAQVENPLALGAEWNRCERCRWMPRDVDNLLEIAIFHHLKIAT